jgi:methylated-DNA-protein-cysteine methyltransferase-like protein
MRSFFERVYEVVAQIPYGKVVSYGQIAWMLDEPHGARAVGFAMRCCPDELPFQRVVRADGSIAGGTVAQLRRALLESEGVPFLPDGRVDIKACQWNGLAGDLGGR